MGGLETVLEVVLAGLLGATLLHAVRLQRALGSLRQDRAALHVAVAGFDSGTREAEAGLSRLRAVADQLGAQVSEAAALREDLAFLMERAAPLADRLDAAVRAGRGMEPSVRSAEERVGGEAAPVLGRLRSAAERNLVAALGGRR